MLHVSILFSRPNFICIQSIIAKLAILFSRRLGGGVIIRGRGAGFDSPFPRNRSLAGILLLCCMMWQPAKLPSGLFWFGRRRNTITGTMQKRFQTLSRDGYGLCSICGDARRFVGPPLRTTLDTYAPANDDTEDGRSQ